ncbi:MAG: GGDEF domain-containing protein [Clostridia bacterium]|nr:GGDEF domain-containing protein [Clostridia bacterium]
MKDDFFAKFLRRHLTGERARTRFLFLSVYFLFATLSLIMTLVILFTIDNGGQYAIFAFLFSALCGLDAYLLFRKTERAEIISKVLFCVEIPAFLILFIIVGGPERLDNGGFSVLWAALVPFAAVLLFKRKGGAIFSLVIFLILGFCFWTPAGRSLLQYDYSLPFYVRFPLFYLACLLLSMFFETVRDFTEKELLRARNNYRKLSFTDQLTGLGNETAYYRFLQKLDTEIKEKNLKFAVVVMDVNGLKATDDTYGHRYGCHLIVTAGHRLPSIFPGCQHFHIGGDEFVVVAEGDACEKLDGYMEAFRKQLTYSKVRYDGKDLILSVAAGVAFSSFGESYGEVFQRADDLMYDNKKRLKEIYRIAGR